MPLENEQQETIRKMLAAEELQDQAEITDPPPAAGPEDEVPAGATPAPLEDVTPLAPPEPEPTPAPEPEVKPEPEPELAPAPEPEGEPDYKAAYEDLLENLRAEIRDQTARQAQAGQVGIPPSFPQAQPIPTQPQGYPQQAPSTTAPGAPVYPSPQPQPPEDLPLINEQQWTQWGEDHGAANKALNRVHTSAVETAMRMLIPMVNAQLQRQRAIDDVTTEFYRKNSDLDTHRDYVWLAANRVYAEHPDWGLDKLLDEASTRVRTRLNLGKGAAKQKPGEQPPIPSSREKPPAPARPGARRATPTLTDTQKDIRGIMGLE